MTFKYSDKHVIPLKITANSNCTKLGLHEVALPCPLGLLQNLEQVRLECNEQAINCAAKVCGTWHDGSIKWLHVSFFIESEHTSDYAIVIYQKAQKLLSVIDELKITEQKECIEIVNINHKFLIDKEQVSLSINSLRKIATPALLKLTNISLHDHQDQLLSNKIINIKMETLSNLIDGTTSAIKVKLYGQFHSNNVEHSIRFEIELTFFKYRSDVKVEYIIHNPKAAIHSNGHWDLGDPNSTYFSSLTFNFKRCDTTPIHYQTELTSQWQVSENKKVKIEQYSSGGKNWSSPVHLDKLNKVPHSICGYQTIENGELISKGQRATPIIQDGDLYTLTLEKFWQNFPKAITFSEEYINVSLFPKQQDSLHELQPGEKKSHTLWLSAEDTKNNLEWVHHPHQIDVPVDWIQSTKVLYPFSQFQKNSLLCQLINTAIDGENSFINKREALDEFGWRNFGDIYADHETAGHEGKTLFVSHYNNQYDPIMGCIKQFLATGNSTWFEIADDLAKHVVDIDIYHTQKDKSEYNGGLFWHTDHYLEAYTSSHRSYSKHQASNAYQDHAGGGGPGGQHCYTTGLMLHYFLTANENSKNAVLTLSNWIANVYEGSGTCLELLLAFKNRHVPGFKNHFTGQYPLDRGTANYLTALLDSYELTQDHTFLNSVEYIIKHTVHPTESVSERSLEDVENTWFYTVLLQVMARYLHVKLNQNKLDESFYYCRDSLLNYAQWMLENEHPYLENPDILEYPNDTWTAQDLRKAHIFASAYYFSPDLKPEFLARSRYFENYVASKLSTSDTKTYTRILVLTMQNYGALDYYLNAPEVTFEHRKSNWPTAPYQTQSFGSTVIKSFFSRFFKISLKQEIEWLKKRLS